MEDMPFPDEYVHALRNGVKNLTVRVADEINRYKLGVKYRAVSYSGENLGMIIRIVEVIKSSVNDLQSFNVPKQEIDEILSHVTRTDELVDVIRFDTIPMGNSSN